MVKGSLQAGLDKLKPKSLTKDQKWWEKEKKKLKVSHSTYEEFCKEKLEERFKRPVKYKCGSCLHVAYEALRDGRTGYVTDEELIESSNNILKHK